MRTTRCMCGHKAHTGTCAAYRCRCANMRPFVNQIVFIPIQHGDRVDLGYGDLTYLGFKPGATKKREGWLVYAIPEHQFSQKARRLIERPGAAP